MNFRKLSFLDKILCEMNAALNTVFADYSPSRPTPAIQETDQLSAAEKRQSAGMIRVNHSGEVCAQALYRGQLLTARHQETLSILQKACEEETDHLAWTDQRLQELASHRSYLNFFWYLNSYLIGILAGLAGDRWSLGFVEETERQVAEHLNHHLNNISEKDQQSRLIIRQMRTDEMMHGETASRAGAAELPRAIKFLMRLHAKVMTTLAYYI